MPLRSPPGGFSQTLRIWSAPGNGRGLRRTASTKLKMAVVPPMPRARVKIAAAANPGLFRIIRSPKRISLPSWSMAPTSIGLPADPPVSIFRGSGTRRSRPGRHEVHNVGGSRNVPGDLPGRKAGDSYTDYPETQTAYKSYVFGQARNGPLRSSFTDSCFLRD